MLRKTLSTDILSPFVQARMRYLQKFLNRLAAHKELRMTDELYMFLCERNEDEWEAVVSASQVCCVCCGYSRTVHG